MACKKLHIATLFKFKIASSSTPRERNCTCNQQIMENTQKTLPHLPAADVQEDLCRLTYFIAPYPDFYFWANISQKMTPPLLHC